MRLIDVDRLIFHSCNDMKGECPYWGSANCGVCQKSLITRAEIDNAPTVEPKKGKWKDITPNHYFTCGGEPLVICPFCEDQESRHVQGIENNMWNFCPNCGADMREADNDKTN